MGIVVRCAMGGYIVGACNGIQCRDNSTIPGREITVGILFGAIVGPREGGSACQQGFKPKKFQTSLAGFYHCHSPGSLL